jgi:hypothetical protein
MEDVNLSPSTKKFGSVCYKGLSIGFKELW